MIHEKNMQEGQVECPNCDGTGTQLGPFDREVRCKLCGGLGHICDHGEDEGVIEW